VAFFIYLYFTYIKEFISRKFDRIFLHPILVKDCAARVSHHRRQQGYRSHEIGVGMVHRAKVPHCLSLAIVRLSAALGCGTLEESPIKSAERLSRGRQMEFPPIRKLYRRGRSEPIPVKKLKYCFHDESSVKRLFPCTTAGSHQRNFQRGAIWRHPRCCRKLHCFCSL
jgi:hypothetical protein